MANGWTNTVPLGQAGTGDAVIYGRNPAAQQFGNQLARYRKNELLQQQLQEEQARKIAQSYRDNALKASSGRLWASELGKQEQQHIAKGMQYRGEGWDVYNPDPNDPRQIQLSDQYLQERADIEARRAYRQGIETEYNKLTDMLRKGDISEYNMEDIQKLNDFISNTSLDQAYSGNMMLPQVSKATRPDEILKGLKANTMVTSVLEGNQQKDKKVVDVESTERAILGRMMSNPAGAGYLQQLTNGIPVNEISGLPDTVEANAQEIISDYDGDPQFRQSLAQDAGIVSKEDPRFMQVVSAMAQTRAQAKRNYEGFMDNAISSVSGGLELYDKSKRAPGSMTDYQRANLARMNRRDATKASGSNGIVIENQNTPIYFGSPNAQTGERPSVTGQYYTPLDLSAKNFVGSKAIDLSTGRPITIPESSNDYSTVGFTVVPVFNKDKKDIPKGSIVRDNYAKQHPEDVVYKKFVHVNKAAGTNKQEDFLVDINNLPKNLTKKDMEYVEAFKNQANVQQNQQFLDLFR